MKGRELFAEDVRGKCNSDRNKRQHRRQHDCYIDSDTILSLGRGLRDAEEIDEPYRDVA